MIYHELFLFIFLGKYILSENSKVLTLTSVQKSDTGVYQCMSENSEGMLLKEAILKVIGSLQKIIIIDSFFMKTIVLNYWYVTKTIRYQAFMSFIKIQSHQALMENNFEVSLRIRPLSNPILEICNWRKHAFLENKKK